MNSSHAGDAEASRTDAPEALGSSSVAAHAVRYRGQEVAARPIGFFLQELERQGHDDAHAILMAGVAPPHDRLFARDARIDWDSFHQILENVGRVWKPHELADVGERLAVSRWMRRFGVVARLLMSSGELYRWTFRPRGVAEQLISCLHQEMREIGPGELELDTWVAEGYRPSLPFFQLAVGSLRAMPRVIGLDSADVEFEMVGHDRARYRVRYPLAGGALSWLRRAVAWPFTARAAARELRDVNELLFERHQQIARERVALSESEERFRRAFHSAPSLMAISSADGRILDVNEAFVRTSGFRRDELIGSRATDMGMWSDPELRNKLVARLRKGETILLEECDFVTRDGERRVGLLSAEALQIGGERCSIWQSLDITERKRAEEANRRFQEQLLQAQKLESLGVMASGIAHDFNNLLVGVLGNAELALAELDPAHEELRERLVAIRTASERAAELTREMLAYAGKGKGSNAPFQIGAVVRETAELVRSGQTRRMMVDVRDVADGLWIRGDETQIRQVIMNLLTNAAESYDDGGGAVRVELFETPASDTADRTVTLEVHDSGCGMDLDTQSKMFDPFFTTKFTGRGLGLAATLGILRAHGATHEVESRPGEGTLFRVRLPRVDGVPASATPTAPEGASERGSGSVLVVDDEAPVRGVARLVLERDGYTVIEAADGASALLELDGMGDELMAIVLDLTMPGMTGDETYHEVRRRRPEVPVLACSGYGAEVGERWLEGKRSAAFIAKPYRAREFLRVLRGLTTNEHAPEIVAAARDAHER